MVICILSPGWEAGTLAGTSMPAASPTLAFSFHTLLTFFLFLEQVFLVGKVPALPDLCRAPPCHSGF